MLTGVSIRVCATSAVQTHKFGPLHQGRQTCFATLYRCGRTPSIQHCDDSSLWMRGAENFGADTGAAKHAANEKSIHGHTRTCTHAAGPVGRGINSALAVVIVRGGGFLHCWHIIFLSNELPTWRAAAHSAAVERRQWFLFFLLRVVYVSLWYAARKVCFKCIFRVPMCRA